MGTLLIRNARCVATFDDQRSELRDASILIRGHVIEAIGPAANLPQDADEVIDAGGHLVVPGLVNTHHHMYQSLTRAIPGVQDAELFSWLRGLYPIWAGLTPEMVQVSTQLAMAELLLSGCTTSDATHQVFCAIGTYSCGCASGSSGRSLMCFTTPTISRFTTCGGCAIAFTSTRVPMAVRPFK